MVCYVVFAVGSCLVIVIVVILFPVVVEKIRRRLETEREKKKVVSSPIQPLSSISYLLLIFSTLSFSLALSCSSRRLYIAIEFLFLFSIILAN
jgi:hypothetical protein